MDNFAVTYMALAANSQIIAELATVKAAGITHVIVPFSAWDSTTRTEITAVLDAAQVQGLKVWLGIFNWTFGCLYRYGIIDYTTIDAIIAYFKDHPALDGWYTDDEGRWQYYTWNNSTTYANAWDNWCVVYQGKLYLSKVGNNLNHTPTNTAYWTYVKDVADNYAYPVELREEVYNHIKARDSHRVIEVHYIYESRVYSPNAHDLYGLDLYPLNTSTWTVENNTTYAMDYFEGMLINEILNTPLKNSSGLFVVFQAFGRNFGSGSGGFIIPTATLLAQMWDIATLNGCAYIGYGFFNWFGYTEGLYTYLGMKDKSALQAVATKMWGDLTSKKFGITDQAADAEAVSRATAGMIDITCDDKQWYHDLYNWRSTNGLSFAAWPINMGDAWHSSLARVDYSFQVMHELGISWVKVPMSPRKWLVWGPQNSVVTGISGWGWEVLDRVLYNSRKYNIKVHAIIPYIGAWASGWDTTAENFYYPLIDFIVGRYAPDYNDLIVWEPCNEINAAWMNTNAPFGQDVPDWAYAHTRIYDRIKSVAAESFVCSSSCGHWYAVNSTYDTCAFLQELADLGRADAFDAVSVHLYSDYHTIATTGILNIHTAQGTGSLDDINYITAKLAAIGRSSAKISIDEWGLFWESGYPSNYSQTDEVGAGQYIQDLYNFVRNDSRISKIIMYKLWGWSSAAYANLFGMDAGIDGMIGNRGAGIMSAHDRGISKYQTVSGTSNLGTYGAIALLSLPKETVSKPTITLNPPTTPTSASSQIITGTRSVGATISVITTAEKVGGVVMPGSDAGVVTYPTATTWQCTLSNLVNGANVFSVIAEDSSGIRTQAHGKITYNQDVAIPVIGTPEYTVSGTSYVVATGISGLTGTETLSMQRSKDGNTWNDLSNAVTDWTITPDGCWGAVIAHSDLLPTETYLRFKVVE